MQIIDLVNELGVDIGASYLKTFRLCNANDLTNYTGYCQVRKTSTDTNVILSPTIEILNKDTFNLKILFSAFTGSTVAGDYYYDVFFASVSDRFYAVGGRFQLIKRITVIV